MPEFMDVHTNMPGVTKEALAEAHQADVDIQSEEGVTFKHAWADPNTGHVFCLSEGPARRRSSASTSAPAIPLTRSTKSRSRPSR